MKRKRTSRTAVSVVENLKNELWRASEEIMRVQSQRDESFKQRDEQAVILAAIERLIRDWRGLA